MIVVELLDGGSIHRLELGDMDLVYILARPPLQVHTALAWPRHGGRSRLAKQRSAISRAAILVDGQSC